MRYADVWRNCKRSIADTYIRTLATCWLLKGVKAVIIVLEKPRTDFETGKYTNTCFCPCGAVQALKIFGTVMAASATINFRVTRMAVCGLFRIRTRFLSMVWNGRYVLTIPRITPQPFRDSTVLQQRVHSTIFDRPQQIWTPVFCPPGPYVSKYLDPLVLIFQKYMDPKLSIFIQVFRCW